MEENMEGGISGVTQPKNPDLTPIQGVQEGKGLPTTSEARPLGRKRPEPRWEPHPDSSSKRLLFPDVDMTPEEVRAEEQMAEWRLRATDARVRNQPVSQHNVRVLADGTVEKQWVQGGVVSDWIKELPTRKEGGR